MTRDGLVERDEATGEETRISQRGQDFNLRDAPPEQARPDTATHPAGRQQSTETVAAADDRPLSDLGRPVEAPASDARAASHRSRQAANSAEASQPRAAPADDSRQRGTSDAKPRQRGTKYQQQFTPEAAKAEQTQAPTSSPEATKATKLQFAPDELPPEPPSKKLTNARRRAERATDKLDVAQRKLPTRRKPSLAKEFDADKGKMKRRLHFDKEVKSQSAHVKGPVPLRPVHAGKNAAIGYGHKKLYQVEHENVGTEAAHKGETVAEGGLRMGYRRMKTAPYRKVTRLSRKASKTNARAAYQQLLHDNPKLKSNALARLWQKQKIKRQYAKAAREAQRAAKAGQKAATATARVTQAVVGVVRRHPVVFGIIALLLLLVFIIVTVFSSFSNMGIGGMGSVFASTYLAEDRDIDDAELYYTEWETDLELEINRAESTHPGYDEYRYEVDDIGYNPYELMGYLTAVYQNFAYADVQAVLRQIFDEQYNLSFVPEVELRYNDPDDENEDGDLEEYEWHILNINLSARSFTDLALARMDASQQQIYGILMQTYGNRQYVSNVFNFNWLPYVSSYYGYRVHPITGEKNYHKAVDIAVAEGTEIRAGHDGRVTQAGSAGDYGLIVVLEGDIPGGSTLTTKYAHCSQLLVSVGQTVQKGDVIAKVGNTGQSTGPHLHLEVLVDGEYLNPLYFAETGDDGSGNLPPGTPGGPDIPAYPGAPMGDGSFAALMEEAQKHLGKPYVFGASGPNSFDCSGFVSYVLVHSGVKDVGRTTAQGLYNLCTPVSRANAQPGDLIFFTGTYSAGRPVTHVGIYIGNGQMIHAGKPVQYSSIDTTYWTQHFYAFGRLN